MAKAKRDLRQIKIRTQLRSTINANFSVVMLMAFALGWISDNDESCLARSMANDGSVSLSAIMPDELKRVELGMTVPELLALRTSAKPVDHPIGSKSSYSEDIGGHKFLGVVFYRFSDNRLNTIVLGGSPSAKRVRELRPEFLAWLRSTWGNPTDLSVRKIQRKTFYYAPVLIWKTKSLQAAVSYTPSRDLNGQPYNNSSDEFAPYFFEIVVSSEAALAFMTQANSSDLTTTEEQNLFSDLAPVGLEVPLRKQ